MDELFLDFLNTSWYITHAPYKDPMEDPKWPGEFFSQANAEAEEENVDTGRLMEFRDAMAAAVDQYIETGLPNDAAIAALNWHLRGALLRPQIDTSGGRFALLEKPQAFNTDYVIYLVVKSFYDFVPSGAGVRLQRCGNVACRWLFVDNSKSHNKKWCSNTCASLIKVRNYRSRKQLGE